MLPALVISVLLLSACAQKQWREPLGENEEKAARRMLAVLHEKQNNCPQSIDTELNATWKSRISDGGINGYLQILLPSSIKLIAVNPLGQPLYAFATNGHRFQTVNVTEGVYKHGRVSTFVRKHSLPKSILHDEWGRWLTGKVPFEEEQLLPLRQDASLRGFWISRELEKSTYFAGEYLLIEPNGRRLLERVATDKDGHQVARVIYKTWTEIGNCPVPTSVEIQSPSYGTTIQIEMKEIQTDKIFTAKDISLKPPRGFLQQYYP